MGIRRMYAVLTWDPGAEAFTPQIGVPSRVIGFSQLRSAIRKLQELGYETTRHGGHSVLIEQVGADDEQ